MLTATLFRILLGLKRASRAGGPLPLEQFRPHDVNRVLIVSCTAIGDSLFATPCIRAVRKMLPEARIHLLVRDRFIDLFRTNPRIDDIMGYKGRYKGALRLLGKFRKNSYDLCLVFHDSDPCPVQAAFLAGIPFIFRIGQRDQRLREYLSCRIPYRQDGHAIDQRLEVVRRVFGLPLDKDTDLRMELAFSSQASDMLWQHLLEETAVPPDRAVKIGLQFSASGTYKTWPRDNFIQLGARLLNASDRHVVCLMGGPGDSRSAKRMAVEIGSLAGSGRRVLNLAGRVELSRFAELCRGLDLLVSNDTGPLHVAIAVGTPTVSLFVPSSPSSTGPVQDLHMHQVLAKERPCSPCIEKYCKNPGCMSLITVEEVYEACLKGLGPGAILEAGGRKR